jgi:hypothetical protein
MAIASNFILNGITKKESYIIYPWISNVSNVIQVHDVIQPIVIPDQCASELLILSTVYDTLHNQRHHDQNPSSDTSSTTATTTTKNYFDHHNTDLHDVLVHSIDNGGDDRYYSNDHVNKCGRIDSNYNNSYNNNKNNDNNNDNNNNNNNKNYISSNDDSNSCNSNNDDNNYDDNNDIEQFSYPRFSMAAGDFVEIYGKKSNINGDNRVDAVVTCFFLDTAPIILDYIETIDHVLKPGGIWINLGPLLYHWEKDQDYGNNDPRYNESIEVRLFISV